MMILKRLFQGLVVAIASMLIVLWTPGALAKTTPSATQAEPSSIQTTDRALPKQERKRSEKTEQTRQGDRQQSATSSKSRSGKTYEQAPHPYDMDAMEAYDEEVYGAGR
ncbi:MAG: hypothetical protein AAGA75_02045 [Cyanobacteria bacterium P01_E01_bin.6]